MNLAAVNRIAAAVLYEGYILYPYRPALKNRQRWTFGGIYPRGYSESHPGEGTSSMQTECLVRGEAHAALEVRIRFLHLMDRRIARLVSPVAELPDGDLPDHEPVDSLQLGGTLHQAWQEAVEREVVVAPGRLGNLTARTSRETFHFSGSQSVEPLRTADGQIAALVLRQQCDVDGAVEITVADLGDQLFRATVRVCNCSPLENPAEASRDAALLRSLVSTHTILGIRRGEFISLTDPPQRYRAVAEACQNLGVWPVLVGQPGDCDTLLSSPIILYDYPQLAPESPGDMFDGTEIDELLALRVLTLTDDEKRAMADVDPRARAILERTSHLAADDLLALHGAVRRLQPLGKTP